MKPIVFSKEEQRDLIPRIKAFVRDELHVGRHAMDQESVDRSVRIERAGAGTSISGPQRQGLG